MLELLLKEHTAASNSGRCSIDTLPEEIWTQIIRSYASKQYASARFDLQYVSVDLLLALMLVSTRWQQRIQDTPTLWTDIALLDSTEDLSLKVALGLHYSKTAPLSLLLLSRGTWSAVRSMAPSMQPRISSLIFRFFFPEEEAEFVISDLCPLPCLTRMSARENRYIDKAFFHQHPLITDLNGGGVLIADLCACLPQLTKLQWNATENMSAIFRHLGGIPHLKEVDVSYTSTDEKIGEFHFGSPAWTRLTYWQHSHRVHSVILNQTKNTLVYLCLRVSISSLVNDLSLTLPELERLESLELILVKSEADVPLKPPHNQKACPVREAVIWFSPLGEGHKSDLPIVCRILQRMVEYVQVVIITTRWPRYIPLLFAETGFTLLVSIVINHSDSLELEDGAQLEQVRLPSSLERLQISGPQALLDMFGSTTVTNIRFEDRGKPTLSASRLSEWSNLRVLNLATIESSFDHFSSPTLKVLSIRFPRNTATITALCQQLAIHGDRCPRLERLEFSECPEWDILMIMLERRNCTPDPAVTPIKYIILPALIPRIIREAVRERIQGRRSPRPSNYELSLQGNIDIICDSDL